MKRRRRDEQCSSGIADAFSLYLRFPPDSTPVILGRPMVVPTEMWDPLFVEELSKSLIWLTTPMQQRRGSVAIGEAPLLGFPRFGNLEGFWIEIQTDIMKTLATLIQGRKRYSYAKY